MSPSYQAMRPYGWREPLEDETWAISPTRGTYLVHDASIMFDQWDDLLLSGGFAPRAILLRGLTHQQASAVPTGAPHSIYQELWHATVVLEKSLDSGRVVLETWPLAEHFPTASAPSNEIEWRDLVARFLAASTRAVSMSQQPGWLESKEPGYDLTWRDALEFLAVHTAYHMGKIVLLRQLLGTWPPPREDAGGA